MIWLRFLAYFVAVLIGTAALTQLEVFYPGSLRIEEYAEPTSTFSTSEYSLVEMLQVGLLMTSGLLMAHVARISRSFRTLAIGIGGISLLFLVRELHFFFDRYVADNVWQALFAVFAALMIAYLYRQQRRLSIAVARAWPSPGLTLLFAGITLLAFSLIVGHEPLWQALLGDDYARITKLAIEEFIELGAYSFWMLGSIEFSVEALGFERDREQPGG